MHVRGEGAEGSADGGCRGEIKAAEKPNELMLPLGL